MRKINKKNYTETGFQAILKGHLDPQKIVVEDCKKIGKTKKQEIADIKKAIPIVYAAKINNQKYIDSGDVLTKQDLSTLLHQKKIKIIQEKLNQNYFRHNGDTNIYDAENFSCSVSKWADWNYYAKNYRYPKNWTDMNVYIDVKSFPVFSPFTVLDGLVTIKIFSKKEISGIIIIKAEWVVVKKGYTFASQVGYIAIKNNVSYHAATGQKALTGLRNKIKRQEPINLSMETIITPTLYSKITGACKIGISSWINQNLQQSKITLKDLLPILEKTNAYGLDKIKALL